jgi:hypothetical protein
MITERSILNMSTNTHFINYIYSITKRPSPSWKMAQPLHGWVDWIYLQVTQKVVEGAQFELS